MGVRGIRYFRLEPAYPVAGCPAVCFDCCIWFSGISSKDTCQEAFFIVADGLAHYRQSGAACVFSDGKDNYAGIFLYFLETKNTDFEFFQLYLQVRGEFRQRQ